MILDTTFLVDLEEELREARGGRAQRFLAGRRAIQPLVTVISMGEIAAGLEDNQAARYFLSRWRVLNLRPEIALTAASVDRLLMQTGDRLGENDNWIAGFARYYGQPLVSNDRAFDRVPGLRRLRY
jgi:predicted nucleic acid-binding protein